MKKKLLSRYKQVLMLQGPMGPFFRRFACDLEKAGAQVHKINFNGGDLLFYPWRSTSYRGSFDDWPVFFEKIIVDKGIDMVLLFGDCRPMHRVAHAIASRHNLEIGVFEEGYVRPDYITFELSGTNGHSKIPRTADFYRDVQLHGNPPEKHVGKTYWYIVLWAILYYMVSVLLWPVFRKYRHHRPLTLAEMFPWIRSGWRKLYFREKERGIEEKLTGSLSGNYFLVPLQVHNDSQLRVHSGFDSIRDFIEKVVYSFQKYAPSETVLVIKHHPLDRGYFDYTRLLKRLAAEYALQNRIFYIHDQHLPTLLEHARGVVVINSTVGLSALDHNKPLKVCGSALYDIQGITFQGGLDEFWKEAPAFLVDRDLFERFRRYLITQTQLNGSFYKKLSRNGNAAGIAWDCRNKQQAAENHLFIQAKKIEQMGL